MKWVGRVDVHLGMSFMHVIHVRMCSSRQLVLSKATGAALLRSGLCTVLAATARITHSPT